VLGADHPDTLWSTNNLAVLYDRQSRYAEAEPLHLETLETRKRVLGADDPDTLQSMYNLAALYQDQGRYAEAEPLHLKTLKTRKRVLGADHASTLWSMNNLADLYLSQGRYGEARPLIAGLLSIRKRRAEDTAANAAAKNEYAWLALTCEPADLQEPASALRIALEAAELTHFENPNYLDTLALAYHRTGDTAKAIETQKKAIALLPEGPSQLRAGMEEALARFEAALAGGE
jgi:tetratricopeptide (TPR) repeat protein